MATTDASTDNVLSVIPERERVCLRPGAVLDSDALRHLEDECRALIGRGFTELTIDLRVVEAVDWSTAAALAAIGRLARSNAARVRLVPGNSPALQDLIHAGLLEDLMPAVPKPFFEWSR